MVAGTRAKLNEEAIAAGETERTRAAEPATDGKLEDAVQRSMNDLEQERRGSGDGSRHQPTYSQPPSRSRLM
jgi:hypothetical protein